MKLLSVTVPCYNSQDYMRKCVESLLKGGDRMEIILIDDGSKDETGAIADEYAEKYPDIVKVVHQENQGHGGGINSGIEIATGKYFKVVDSDDSLDFVSLIKVLDKLEQNDIDMLVTNYKYVHEDSSKDRVISYGIPLPKDKVVTWNQIRSFSVEQYLTIHSVAFRTEKVRQSKVKLPLHVFYEDNVFVYTVIPFVEKMMYLDVNLYQYTIGREGQSVQEDIIKKRYKHQILASKTIFTTYHLGDIRNRKLRSYMYHECVMMLLIAVVFARLNRTEEAEGDIKKMWEECRAFDLKYAKRIHKYSLAMLVSMEGKTGREIGIILYKFAHKVVRFN